MAGSVEQKVHANLKFPNEFVKERRDFENVSGLLYTVDCGKSLEKLDARHVGQSAPHAKIRA